MHGQTKFAAAWRSLLTTAVLVGIVNSSSAAEPGDLAELRSKALELVNKARQQHGLPALQSRLELDRAAQAHAEDMLSRNYFDHVSPEGKTVFDRYVAAGGSRWRLVAENIGRCATCEGPPRISDVTRLQDGWMRSASHRDNILSRGVTQFGSAWRQRPTRGLYAVQSFAGPGTSPSSKKKEALQIGAADLCPRSDQPRAATKGRSRAQAGHRADGCPPIDHRFDRYGICPARCSEPLF
jgi:uncharacterized protein YkwD